MQALYRWQLNEAPWQDLVKEFASEEGMDKADGEYFRELVSGVCGARPMLDAELAALDGSQPARSIPSSTRCC